MSLAKLIKMLWANPITDDYVESIQEQLESIKSNEHGAVIVLDRGLRFELLPSDVSKVTKPSSHRF